MADDLYWVFTLGVQPGKFAQFRSPVADIVAASRKSL
jgi:hypothetical protein